MSRTGRAFGRSALTVGLLGLAAVAALLAMRRPAGAQTPTARAFVTPGGEIGVGRTFVLSVEISGTQSVDREPVLPDLTAFADYLGSSRQSSVSMVNGQTTVSVTLQYRYQAVAEGRYSIPALEVPLATGALSTEPIALTISADAAGGPDPSTGLAEEDLFITAEASSSTVREGQPFTVDYRIWTRVDVTSFGVTRVPEPEGFWVEDLTPGGQPNVEQRTRDGVQYATALIRRVALVPTGSGTRTIEPVGIEAQVRVRRGGDPFESVFGRSSLFGTTTVATTVLSNPLTVEVVPLPSPRPDDFGGMVGTLTVDASVDRDSVDAGEAVTLTVRMSGEGSVRALTAPELGLPADFEVFPPDVSESVRPTEGGLAGTKTFEFVLIPRAPGRREIPPVEVAYFDPSSGAYRTASSAALPITVEGEVVEGPAALSRGGVEQLREDIRFIRLGDLELRRTSSGSLAGRPVFWLFLLLPLSALAGAVALRRHRDLLAGDVAYARGRKAGRVARRRLAEARSLAGGSDRRAFYAEVARALRGFVADRLNLAEAGLQTRELGEILRERGVDAEVRSELIRCLEQCDRQRFAPAGDDPSESSRVLEQAEALMGALDRELPR